MSSSSSEYAPLAAAEERERKLEGATTDAGALPLIAQQQPKGQRHSSRPVDADYESRQLREVQVGSNYRRCWFSRQEPSTSRVDD